jgi:hypothetical protein
MKNYRQTISSTTAQTTRRIDSQMASYAQRVKAVAQALIATVGAAVAVNSTDVRTAAAQLHKEYAEYSEVDIRAKVASEIKQVHRPGISGSV